MRWKINWRVAAAAVCGAVGLSAAGFALGLASNGGALSLPVQPNVTCPTSEVLLAHADGAVSIEASAACSGLPFYGSMAGKKLNSPIVGLAATPQGTGYWLVAADGGVFGFGSAQFYGSTGNLRLNSPIVGMASSPDGGGYWLVAADGGVFAFGDAHFMGSMGGQRLVQPVVGMAADVATGGYWLVAKDGGVFTFGTTTPYFGSLAKMPLNAPIRFVSGTPDGNGYRMVGADGGVFNFGDAQFYGSAAAPGSQGWEALSATRDGGGYWLFAGTPGTSGVSVASFGDGGALIAAGGDASSASLVGAATLFTSVAPVVTVNPVSVRVAPGATATFTAAASGFPTPGVQWQVSIDNGMTFSNIANANSTTFSFPTLQSYSGGQYRAVFTNGAGTATTTAATLAVGNAPVVTTEPTNQTVPSGGTATFTAAASGTPDPTVLWQVSTDGGVTWFAAVNQSSDTLSFTATTGMSGNEYRALFTNPSGTATTTVVTLTVTGTS